jgi:predicted nucleotidyltransferase
MNKEDLFANTSYQKILKFLSDCPNKNFFEKEISDKIKLSRGGTNSALKKLRKTDLITVEKKGKTFFYSSNLQNPLIKAWKVFNNVIKVSPVIKNVKKISDKIILFGSMAEGINIKESDIDLLIITHSPEAVRKTIAKNKKIQLILRTPLEFIEMKAKDPVFFDEVNKGIVLWEKTT